jgi:hypothetical protein
MTEFNFDSLGKVIIELRDDAEVAAIVGNRVGWEPGPGWAAVQVTPQGPRYTNAFVLVNTLVTPRHPRLPIQRPRIAVRCYGRTPEEAGQLYVASSNALHGAGPRVHSNGLGIYTSHDVAGGSGPEKDPDTGQPYYSFIAELIATTQAVTT